MPRVTARVVGKIAFSFRPTLLRTLLAGLLVALAPQIGSAQVLLGSPHPDDEALFASGIIYQAKQLGKTVKVVLLTNGDCDAPGLAQARQQESITAMTRLGLAANDVIFLGYPDCGIRTIY